MWTHPQKHQPKCRQAMASTVFFPRCKLRAFVFLMFLVSTITLFVTPLCVLVFEHYHANQLSQQNRQLLKASQPDLLSLLPPTVPHGVQYTRRQRVAKIKCFTYFNTVCYVLKDLGYTMDPTALPSKTDVLWTRGKPFMTHGIKRINHVRATRHLWQKPNLLDRSNNISVIAPAYYLPAEKTAFNEYVRKHPEVIWIRKGLSHRKVRIDAPENMNRTGSIFLAQEYLTNPLLISNRKFDIGVFTLVTSVHPLRMYIYAGDFQIKFCPVDYLPFDPNNLDKYVEREIFNRVWEIPAFMKVYTEGKRDKDLLYTYLDNNGYSGRQLDDNMLAAATEVGCKIEKKMAFSYDEDVSPRESFEFMRFDFLVDTDLKAWVIEINMTPDTKDTLKLKHKKLFTTMLSSTMVMAGLVNGSWTADEEAAYTSLDTVSNREINVDTDECKQCGTPQSCMTIWQCTICSQCLKDSDHFHMKKAVLEHRRRGSWTRVVPPPFKNQKAAVKWQPDHDPLYKELSVPTQKMALWYRAKCIKHADWCS